MEVLKVNSKESSGRPFVNAVQIKIVSYFREIFLIYCIQMATELEANENPLINT